MNGSTTRAHSGAAGFGLVELMIALVLGLVVLGAVISVYINNIQAARFQTGVMRAQENGRFAVDVLSRTIRMAGYDAPDTELPKVNAPFVGGSTSSAGARFTQAGLKPDGDTLWVTYERGLGIPDCHGNPDNPPDAVSNQFAIWTDDNAISHLVCNTANDNGEPPPGLAEGVEDIQVLYGIDSNGDEVANRYVSADNVANWSQVVAVQVALLVNSVVPALGQDDTVCLGCSVFAGTNDRLVRAEFQTTIDIRNCDMALKCR